MSLPQSGRFNSSRKQTLATDNPALLANDVYAKQCQVVTGLTNLQNAIGELIHAYLSHTNVVLGGGVGSISDTLAISNPASLAAATGGAGGVSGAGAGGTVGVFGGDGGKKKRARKERDPNAPKRPLTAYFLFAQNARGYVRRDLEAQKPDVKPGDISTESTRRWHEMDPDEQEVRDLVTLDTVRNRSFANRFLKKIRDGRVSTDNTGKNTSDKTRSIRPSSASTWTPKAKRVMKTPTTMFP